MNKEVEEFCKRKGLNPEQTREAFTELNKVLNRMLSSAGFANLPVAVLLKEGERLGLSDHPAFRALVRDVIRKIRETRLWWDLVIQQDALRRQRRERELRHRRQLWRELLALLVVLYRQQARERTERFAQFSQRRLSRQDWRP